MSLRLRVSLSSRSTAAVPEGIAAHADPILRKSYPLGNSLRNHLKSPAHSHVRYQCPSCLQFFGSATALTAHSESQSRRCHIRDTDDYNQYLDQLTGGIAEARGRHDADHTVRYGVQRGAARTYNLPLAALGGNDDRGRTAGAGAGCQGEQRRAGPG